MSTNEHETLAAAGTRHPEDSNRLAVNILATTLFGKTRRQLLALLYGTPQERFYLRQLATAAGVAVGAAQRELAELTSAGIIQRKVEGRQVYFQANRACPVFGELRSILEKTGAKAGPAGAAAEKAPVATTGTGNRPSNPPPAPRPLRPAAPPNPAFVWMTKR